ncbi:MAG TPA: metal-dependent hydrolase [Planctomycetota bacterium]|nr:metal-dependent hydrolase [Planctomycetota bacterium]
MASCFSHPAVPLAIACWAPSMRRAPILVAAALLSAAPDLDAIGFFLGVPYAAPHGHRGLTHSLLFGALLGALVGLPLARRLRAPPRKVAAFLAAAAASHGLVDMTTDGGEGIALFWPFTDARVFFPFRPIAVAPLGVRAFFTRWGVEVLASEALWLWTPALLIGALGLLATGRRDAPAS